jgi:L-iditol 2-dehydrogenase
MKAVVYHQAGDIRIENIHEPKIEAGGLLVKVQACAICGTDLKMYQKGDPRVPPGQIIGHEFVGEIVECGPRVQGYAVGERVTMATSISCGRCGFCQEGFTNRCEHLTPISRTYPGAFAEYIAIPASGVEGGFVIKVPKTLGEIAALAEPVSCAVNAQILAGVKQGDTVVVMGCGPLGAIHTQVARARGAVKVIATGRSAWRLKQAESLEIDAVIDTTKVDLVDEVMRMTDGLGADMVIATIPTIESQEQAFSLARKGGMVNLFAGLPRGQSSLTVDSRLIHYREIFVSGASDSTPQHVELAVKLLAKGPVWDRIVTHRFPLGRFMEALRLMEQRQCLKILIYPE